MDKARLLEAQVRDLEAKVYGAAQQLGRRDAVIEQLRRRPAGRVQVGWAQVQYGRWNLVGLSEEPPAGGWVPVWVDLADVPDPADR